MALPTALIGSQSKSVFEEIGRRLRKKNRKVLWAIWYFLWSFPWVLIVWLSSLFTWVDVYGIPAKKPCNLGLDAALNLLVLLFSITAGSRLQLFFCNIFQN